MKQTRFFFTICQAARDAQSMVEAAERLKDALNEKQFKELIEAMEERREGIKKKARMCLK